MYTRFSKPNPNAPTHPQSTVVVVLVTAHRCMKMHRRRLRSITHPLDRNTRVDGNIWYQSKSSSPSKEVSKEESTKQRKVFDLWEHPWPLPAGPSEKEGEGAALVAHDAHTIPPAVPYLPLAVAARHACARRSVSAVSSPLPCSALPCPAAAENQTPRRLGLAATNALHCRTGDDFFLSPEAEAEVGR